MSTPDYIYPIIVPSYFDIEDAFSSTNTPDYTPASPDYSPASPGNTSSNPSKDLSKDLLASLALSPFYDDPYMKVMQAYNATNNESPIPLPRAPIAPSTILPLSSVLKTTTPMFLSHVRVSHKTRLERHEEQIETIPNFDQLEIKLQEACTQISGFQREQVRYYDEIVLAHVRISTLEMIIEDIQVRHRSYMQSLLDTIHELKNHKGGPPDY
ncbi:hypothetical protein Tco_1082900 [Tanacetum coccineum]|uniref:Uncharacterized protein n=1 Tax=Tanacetum coccineum TaxID=301880 RepID=A0ABQ5I1X5_9ASTR